MRGLEYASQICYSSLETLMFTHNACLKLKDIEGDLVECGVAAGAQIIAMLVADETKTIHAFDSFEGIPLASNRDHQIPGIKELSNTERKLLPNPGDQVLESSGVTVVPEVDFLNHINKAFWPVDRSKQIVIHSGWFEETTKESNIEKISLLRLDGDLYNSTLVCLQNLYPLVVNGGMVIIDDWALRGSREAVIDYFGGVPSHYLIEGNGPDSPCYFYK